MAECGCSYTSCWRYFRELQRRRLLKLIFEKLVEAKTDITECAADTDSTTSFRFNRGVGYDGRHRKYATKISLFSDKDGLPADVVLGSGNTHDKTLLYQHLENIAGKRVEELNLDKVYVSIDLRREMRKKGTHVNMQLKRGDYIRKRGPKFKLDEEKYKVRFQIERLFGWLENFRHLRIRRERHLAMFQAFVYLALIIILIRN